MKERLDKLDRQLEALESKIEAAEAEHLAAVASGQPELVAAALKARLDRLVKKEEAVAQERAALELQLSGAALFFSLLHLAAFMASRIHNPAPHGKRHGRSLHLHRPVNATKSHNVHSTQQQANLERSFCLLKQRLCPHCSGWRASASCWLLS